MGRNLYILSPSSLLVHSAEFLIITYTRGAGQRVQTRISNFMQVPVIPCPLTPVTVLRKCSACPSGMNCYSALETTETSLDRNTWHVHTLPSHSTHKFSHWSFFPLKAVSMLSSQLTVSSTLVTCKTWVRPQPNAWSFIWCYRSTAISQSFVAGTFDIGVRFYVLKRSISLLLVWCMS